MPVLVLLVTLLLLPAMVTAEPLRVFTSVLPLKTFVERVGGEHVVVQSVVQPGFSPHTYEPTPRQLGELADAALYVRTGMPFEEAWLPRFRAANADMQIVDARNGIELRELEYHVHDDGDGHGQDHGHKDDHHAHDDGHGHGHGDDHGHGAHAGNELDPHVWTSPVLVQAMATTILDALVDLDPANAPAYRQNHATLVAELERLDRELRSLLEPLPRREFMVFHPAWGYFAETYGLRQVPIEHEGKEPGARTLARLIAQARDQQIRVVFVQPQFDDRQARRVADAIEGRVIAVDPLAADYADNLRRVATAFAEAMQ